MTATPLSRYYYPEDCVGVESDSKFELLESPHLDDNEVFVVMGKATVLTHEEFYQRQASDPKWRPGATNTFFARRFYDPLTKLCRPLHGSLQHNKYRWWTLARVPLSPRGPFLLSTPS